MATKSNKSTSPLSYSARVKQVSKPKTPSTKLDNVFASLGLPSITPTPTTITTPIDPNTYLNQPAPALYTPPPVAPVLDGRAILAKLTSGQALTDEEKKYLNMTTGGTTTGTTTGSTTTGTTTNVPTGFTGSATDYLNYTNAIANANEALGKAGVVNALQVRKATAAGDVATRQAERDIYNASQSAVNQLAQRGLSGASGLKVAAQRAAIVSPQSQKLQAINTMKENVSAANLLLAEEQAKSAKAIQDANAAMIKAQNVYNKLGV